MICETTFYIPCFRNSGVFTVDGPSSVMPKTSVTLSNNYY